MPNILSRGSAGSSSNEVTPMTANIRQISTLRPIRIRYAVSPGAPQAGAYCVKWNNRLFQISLIQSMHQNARPPNRSEEHTSELQSLMRISYAVFCLKKKKPQKQTKD